MNPLIKPLLKLIEAFGGFAGIQKTLDGKKTYTACVASILGGLFGIAITVYMYGEKTIDANGALATGMICFSMISGGARSLFQRMATAKATQTICAKPEQPANQPANEIKP